MFPNTYGIYSPDEYYRRLMQQGSLGSPQLNPGFGQAPVLGTGLTLESAFGTPCQETPPAPPQQFTPPSPYAPPATEPEPQSFILLENTTSRSLSSRTIPPPGRKSTRPQEHWLTAHLKASPTK